MKVDKKEHGVFEVRVKGRDIYVTSPLGEETRAYIVFKKGREDRLEFFNELETRVRGTRVRGMRLSPGEWEELRKEREKAELAELQLVPAGQTEDWGVVYKLSARISHEMWGKIKHCMMYLDIDSEAGLDADLRGLGWVVRPGKEEEVERLLGIPEERRVKTRQAAAEAAREERRRGREEAIEEARTFKTRYGKIFPDLSWDDYAQRVGEMIERGKHWSVHRYFNGQEVGVCLKQNPNSKATLGVIGFIEIME